MIPEFDEVLLTAYLDEEVTDAERTAVEEQLRISESSRKLLEELRSVRSLVRQLHLTQPSRSFQSGPWNETALASESPQVVLNHSRSLWGMSYQKLATIAALIAVAFISSILFLDPNSTSISRSISRSGDTGPAARPLASKAEESSENSTNMPFGGPPAPRAAGTPSSRRESTSPGVASKPEPLNPSVQTLLQTLSKVSSDNQYNWVVMESLGDGDASNALKDNSGEVDPTVSLGRTRAVDSNARYSYRYKNSIEREPVADKNKSLQENRSAENSARTESDTKETQPPLPILIELQIPREDWGDGAKRLRELGIDVPVELPSVEFMDFTATSAPASRDLFEPSEKAGTQSPEVTLWSFRRADTQGGAVELEFFAKPAATGSVVSTTTDFLPSAGGKELNRAPPLARIRVRVIKN